MKVKFAIALLVLWSNIGQSENLSPINKEIQTLREQVISLNRDLQILEQKLVYPSETKVAVYVSMTIGDYFELDAIELKIDGVTQTSFLYTDKQNQALRQGGIQRLFVGNIKRGMHDVTAVIRGKGVDNSEYIRAISGRFGKMKNALTLELKILDSSAVDQPVFNLVEF
ncbi:MAG: hypothetical protein HRU25_06420 [Psychrobium sp.]|nr:hypothetical protein [Psychrobium sp.]